MISILLSRKALARLGTVCLCMIGSCMVQTNASTFNVGGGTITTSSNAFINDDTGIMRGAAVFLDHSGSAQTVSVMDVFIRNTAGSGGSARALWFSESTGLGAPTIIMTGTTLISESGGSGLYANFTQGLTLITTGGSANTVTSRTGYELASGGGNISINTSADRITAERSAISATAGGSVMLDSVGGHFSSSDYLASTFELNGANVVVGSLNGGFAGAATSVSGYAFAITAPQVNITIANSGSVAGTGGISWRNGTQLILDNSGTFVTSISGDPLLRNWNDGTVTATLRSGSTTRGIIQGGSGNDSLTIYTGANIAASPSNGFDRFAFGGGDGGTDIVFLKGDGTGTFDTGNNMSGVEVLQKDDSGTWTLTALGNSNTTSFLINTGTISVTSSAAFGQSSSSITLRNSSTLKITADGTFPHNIMVENSPIIDTSGRSIVYSGQVSDGATTGKLTLIGGGNLSLTNSLNSYSGGTDVQDNSTLVLGNSSVLGSGAIVLGNAMTSGTLRASTPFTLDRSVELAAGGGKFDTNGFDITLSAVLAGGGNFRKEGSGTLVLTNDNTYTGTTIISAGTLQVGDGGATGTIAGNVTNNASLVFNRSDGMTFTNAISGTGMLTQTGTGTLTLSGANSYTGATAINIGTLQAGAANSLASGSAVTIANGATLVLNNFNNSIGSVAGAGSVMLGSGTLSTNGDNSSTTFSGVISGTGGLTKNGTGALTLSGTNTYSGPTLVNAGTLIVNGSILNSTITLAGGALKGSGTMGSVAAQSGTTIAPGNSIGTLNTVNVGFAPGSIYEVEVNAAGASDLIAASGTATLTGGTVQVLTAAEGFSTSATYTILTASGGVTGSFTNVTVDNAALRGFLSYTANSILLNLLPVSLPAGATANQGSARAAIMAGGTSGNATYTALGGANAATAQAAYDRLSGEAHASLLSAAMEQGLTVRRVLIEHTHDRADDEGKGFWIAAGNSWGTFDGTANTAEASREVHQITAGFDARLAARWVVGIAGGYGQETLKVGARMSRAHLTLGHAGLYAAGHLGPVDLRAGFSQAWGHAKTTRAVAFTTINDSTASKQDLEVRQVFAEASHPFALDAHTLAPFVGLAWMEAHAGGATETGGVTALQIGSANLDGVFSTLGLEASTTMGVVTPSLRAAWQHDFRNNIASRRVGFVATGQSFTVIGATLDADRFLIDAAIAAQLMPRLNVSLGYRGALSAAANDNAVRANLGWRF